MGFTNSGVRMDIKASQQMTPLEKSLAATVGGALVAAGVAMGTLVGSPASADEVDLETGSSGAQGVVPVSAATPGAAVVPTVVTSMGWDRDLHLRAADIEKTRKKSSKSNSKSGATKKQRNSGKQGAKKSTSADLMTAPPPSTGSQGQVVWDLLIAEGFSPAAAAGILGNLQQESNIDPTAVQADGPGVGLAQWSRGGRWDTGPNSLLAFAQERGLDPWSAKTQTKFMIFEMQYGDLGFDLSSYQDSTDVVAAAEYFHDVFERSADTADYVTKVRGGYAKEWLQQLG